MVMFFAKNKNSASRRLNRLKREEKLCHTGLRLAKKQIPHVAGWKTWTFKPLKCKRIKK